MKNLISITLFLVLFLFSCGEPAIKCEPTQVNMTIPGYAFFTKHLCFDFGYEAEDFQPKFLSSDEENYSFVWRKQFPKGVTAKIVNCEIINNTPNCLSEVNGTKILLFEANQEAQPVKNYVVEYAYKTPFTTPDSHSTLLFTLTQSDTNFCNHDPFVHFNMDGLQEEFENEYISPNPGRWVHITLNLIDIGNLKNILWTSPEILENVINYDVFVNPNDSIYFHVEVENTCGKKVFAFATIRPKL